MTIIGQDKLISKIDKFTLDTFPRTCILEGPKGSGKHLISNYIATKFNLEIEDITSNLSLEYITEITLRTKPYLYTISCSDLTIKNENTILKLLEEPLKSTYIVLLVENKNLLLNTIVNRCYHMVLEPYNKQTLATFLNKSVEDKELVICLSETPGDVLAVQSYPLKDMADLCIKIFDKISVANYANTLTLANNIAFKNEKDKFDLNVFFKMLLMISRDRIYTHNNYYEYFITNDFYNKLKIKNIDKKYLFDNYLLTLKEHISSLGVN